MIAAIRVFGFLFLILIQLVAGPNSSILQGTGLKLCLQSDITALHLYEFSNQSVSYNYMTPSIFTSRLLDYYQS